MSRRLLSAVGFTALFVSLGCSNSPFNRGGGGSQTYRVTLDAPGSVNADLQATGTINVTVTGSEGTPPPNGKVEVTVSGGTLLAGGGDGGGVTTTATLDLDGAGRASVTFKCVGADGRTAFTGPVNVSGVLLANGDDPSAAVRATDTDMLCRQVTDSSGLAMNAPAVQQGSIARHPLRVQVNVTATDIDGALAPDNTPVDVTVLAPTFGVITTDPAGLTGSNVARVNTLSGSGTFYVLYPGDDRVLSAPLTYSLEAKFTNRLLVQKVATLDFDYGLAPDDSEVKFVEATTAQGTPNIPPRGTDAPVVADMAAGSTADGVNLKVQIKGRDGAPPPANSIVTFTCRSDSNAQNCDGFTGYSTVSGVDAGIVSFLPSASVRSTIEAATAATPERAVATVLFQANANSTPGTVYITGRFKADGATEKTTVLVATINLVDNTTLSVSAAATPPAILSTDVSTISVAVRRGTGALANREVCFDIDSSNAVRGYLNDSADDTQSTAAIVPTDGTGVATIRLVPVNTVTRGPVTVQVTVVDVAYDMTRDTQNQPCRRTDPTARVMDPVVVQIDRTPILQNILFTGATPTAIGVQGGPLPSTSALSFKVIDDSANPIANQVVTFELDDNRDPTASVTPVQQTDAAGVVVAFLNAGVQAAALTVRATATRDAATVSVAADPVAVVGGVPAWAPMQINVTGSTRVFSDVTTGYSDPFGTFSRPQGTEIGIQLVDRFSARVQRAGFQIQLRAESGHLPQSVVTDPDGRAVASYTPGPIFNMDTSPISGERREIVAERISHQDAPQNVYRVANPRDGDISILIATRGEESFVDHDGDGSYDPSEPFTDMPEPFLDRNNDGLRATCDLPIDRLPVHADARRRAAGIGTFCNPLFVSTDQPSDVNPDTGMPYTPEECRAHWCPDWDQTWNCGDANAVGGRTPEAAFAQGSTTVITGGRVLWCPTWRYRDIRFGNITLNGTGNQTTAQSNGAQQQLGWNVMDGFVGVPGIAGLVLADDTPISATTNLIDRGVLALDRTGTPGTISYKAPGDTTAGAAIPLSDPRGAANPLLARSRFALKVTSSGGKAAYVLVDPTALNFSTSTGTQVTTAQVEFAVGYGDQRSPFSDFDRANLRISQTDQFIDGNNNGVWDDVNGSFDTDTLIWKTLTLKGNNVSSYFRYPEGVAFPDAVSTSDWRHPGPMIDGKPNSGAVAVIGTGRYADSATTGPVVLFDRMHSYLHIIPDGAEIGVAEAGGFVDTVSATDHSGSSDIMVAREGTTGRFVLRLVDENGVPVCQYSNVTIQAFFGLLSTTEALFTPDSYTGCNEGGYYPFSVEIPFTGSTILELSPNVFITYDTTTGVAREETLTFRLLVYPAPIVP